MALIKPFTDAAGVAHTAYWRLVQNNNAASPRDRSVTLTFLAYRDAEAFASGLEPLPGGEKTYVVTGAEFDALVSAPPVGASLLDAIAHAGEGYALARRDTPTGEFDADGAPVLASFFDGAGQV